MQVILIGRVYEKNKMSYIKFLSSKVENFRKYVKIKMNVRNRKIKLFGRKFNFVYRKKAIKGINQ